jgi:hypothetical protein
MMLGEVDDRARGEIVRSRAIHEAGHCLWIWRSGKVVYGERFDYSRAPIREVLIRPFDDRDLSAEIRERLEGADGRIVCSAELYRLSVAACRELPGCTPAKRRRAIARAKERAACEVLHLVAGPLVEHYDVVRDELAEDPGTFGWRTERDSEEDCECVGDISNALAIAESELCRGGRQAHDYLDGAVDRLQKSLRDDPRYWRTIDALAGALEAGLRLGHDEAVEIMRQAWGEKQG